MSNTAYHNPVMLQQCIDALDINPDGIYVDVTFGGGGHSHEILKHLGPKGKLLAFDQDNDAIRNLPDDDRLWFINHNFKYLTPFLRFCSIDAVDGILADFGVSSHQLDEGERGFAHRIDARLDMRMNRNQNLSAFEVVNQYSESQLADVIYFFGELTNARKIASAIVSARSVMPIETTNALKNILEPLAPKHREFKFYAQVFQALRMEINNETSVIETLLEQGTKALKPDGRFVVMSYHSLEDRLVKNYFKTGNVKGISERDLFGNTSSPLEMVSKKAIVASDQEIESNPRARSAKLRVARKTANHG